MISTKGVPALLNAIAYPQHLAIQTISLSSLFDDTVQLWGIFKEGKAALPADGCVSLDFRDGATITNAPQEQGKLISYNKVAEPYQARVMLIKSGTPEDRAEFLTALENIIETLDLYDVVCPEKVYTRANVTSYEIRRTPENGFELLQVEVVLQEVMSSPRIQNKTTATPDGASQQNNGQVEAK